MSVHIRIVASTPEAEGALRLYVTDDLRGRAKRIGGAFGVNESRVVGSLDPFTVYQRIWVDGKYAGVFDKQFFRFGNSLREIVRKHMRSHDVVDADYVLDIQQDSFGWGGY